VSFPVYLPIGDLRLHPHFVFEALAYFVGFRLNTYDLSFAISSSGHALRPCAELECDHHSG
jgi:hypothetical protein